MAAGRRPRSPTPMVALGLLVLGLVALTSSSLSTGVEAQSAFNPKLGGLPKLFPPQPVFDCRPYTTCDGCTSQISCGFCFSEILVNATGGQAITGTCTHINDAPAAAACPIQKRFYTPGQCVSVYIAGCLLDTKGVCHEQHLYSDAAARTSQLQWARDWMIIVMVTLGAIFLVCLSANAAPYYAKSDMDHDQWWLPTQAFALVPALILQLVGLGLNRWSSMNNLDAMHYFSPFGEWSQYNQLTMYSCHDTNPGADLDLCRVLPAAAILAAIGAVLAATCAFFYLASACACAIWADDDDWMLKPVDTFFWRVVLLGCLGSCGAAALWGSAHLILRETSLRPTDDGPFGDVHMTHSWRLQIAISCFYVYAVARYAFEINTATEPLDWSKPTGCCGGRRRKQQEAAIDDRRAAIDVNSPWERPVHIGAPIETAAAVVPVVPAASGSTEGLGSSSSSGGQDDIELAALPPRGVAAASTDAHTSGGGGGGGGHGHHGKPMVRSASLRTQGEMDLEAAKKHHQQQAAAAKASGSGATTTTPTKVAPYPRVDPNSFAYVEGVSSGDYSGYGGGGGGGSLSDASASGGASVNYLLPPPAVSPEAASASAAAATSASSDYSSYGGSILTPPMYVPDYGGGLSAPVNLRFDPAQSAAAAAASASASSSNVTVIQQSSGYVPGGLLQAEEDLPPPYKEQPSIDTSTGDGPEGQ